MLLTISRCFSALLVLFLEQTYASDVNATRDGVTGVQEYCEGQSFVARCPNVDEVVLMVSAHYGRMRLGRCLTANYGNVGCQLDVTSQFDVWCSGQRRCDVRVSSIIDSLPDNTLPCVREFRGYLEASFVCVKVITVRKEQCTKGNTVEVPVLPGRGGYLASVVTEETKCGSLDTPWLLRAPAGQTIRLNLLDFQLSSTTAEVVDIAQKTCQVYAVIKEKLAGRTSTTICASSQRDSVVYSSATSLIEIRIVSSRQNSKTDYFMLKYEVTGCPDPVVPGTDGGAQWMERKGAVAVFGCNGTHEVWQLKCEADQWIGDRRNCTKTPPADVTYDYNTTVWHVFTGSQWAALFVILTIAIAIGMVIFFVGLLYIKRRRSSQLVRASRGTFGSPMCGIPDYHMTTTQCPEHGLMPAVHPQHAMTKCPASGLTISPSTTDQLTSPAYGTCPTENDYFQTWQLQRHNIQPTARPMMATSGPISTGRGPPGSRIPPSGLPLAPDSPCRAPVIEHIYESPKFDKRPDSVQSTGLMVSSGTQECICCGAPAAGQSGTVGRTVEADSSPMVAPNSNVRMQSL